MNRLLGIAAAAVALSLFGVLGATDFQDDQMEAELYCANVRAGIWPDYQGTYRKHCKPPKPTPRMT